MPFYKSRALRFLGAASLATVLAAGACELRMNKLRDDAGKSAAEWVDNYFGNKFEVPQVPEYYQK